MNLPFVERRRERWTRLRRYIEKSQKERLTAFTEDELIEFFVLYRQAASDLALAQTKELPADLLRFLNDLVGRAYNQLYRSQISKLQNIKALFGKEFPALIRRHQAIILFSLGLLFVGWVFGFCGYFIGPEVIHKFVPEGFSQKLIADFEQHHWFNEPLVARTYISARIMYNNICVALTAFAGGMLLGTYTLYILFFNGLLLGVLSAAFYKHHYLLAFWAMILPHGVVELTAIGLAGAGGLILARAILFPGEYSRKDALRIHSGTAAKLILGTVGLLIVAGTIEGFFSMIDTRVLPEAVRLLFAAGTGIFLLWYFHLGKDSQS